MHATNAQSKERSHVQKLVIAYKNMVAQIYHLTASVPVDTRLECYPRNVLYMLPDVLGRPVDRVHDITTARLPLVIERVPKTFCVIITAEPPHWSTVLEVLWHHSGVPLYLAPAAACLLGSTRAWASYGSILFPLFIFLGRYTRRSSNPFGSRFSSIFNAEVPLVQAGLLCVCQITLRQLGYTWRSKRDDCRLSIRSIWHVLPNASYFGDTPTDTSLRACELHAIGPGWLTSQTTKPKPLKISLKVSRPYWLTFRYVTRLTV